MDVRLLRNRHSLGLLPCPENDPFSGIPSLSSRILVLSLLSWQCMPSPNLVFRILALGSLRSKWEPSSRPHCCLLCLPAPVPLTGPEGRRHCFCFFFHKQQILCHLVFEPNHYNIVKSHLNRLQSRHFVVTIFLGYFCQVVSCED